VEKALKRQRVSRMLTKNNRQGNITIENMDLSQVNLNEDSVCEDNSRRHVEFTGYSDWAGGREKSNTVSYGRKKSVTGRNSILKHPQQSSSFKNMKSVQIADPYHSHSSFLVHSLQQNNPLKPSVSNKSTSDYRDQDRLVSSICRQNSLNTKVLKMP
jgi:hypothetical protein